MKKFLFAVTVASLIATAPVVQASLGPGEPGRASPVIRTGPMVTERVVERETRSIAFEDTSRNTRLTADGVHKGIDTNVGNTQATIGHNTAREQWTAQERRQDHWKKEGQDARGQVAGHKSFAYAEVTSFASATNASTLQPQDIQASMNDIDPGFRAKYGCGPACQSIQAVTLACEAKLPNKTASEGFAQTGLFGGCQYDQKVSGSCENPNKLNSDPTGVKFQNGHPHTRAIAACTALTGLVPAINAKSAALGFPNVKAYMQAELRMLKEKKELAGLRFKDPYNVLASNDPQIILASTETSGEIANQALASFGSSMARAGTGTVTNQYLANGTVRGSDEPYRPAATANQQATGRPSCAENGWQGSRNCRASEAAGAYAHSARGTANEEGGPMARTQLIAGIAGNGELARNRINPSGGDPGGGMPTALVESLRDLASILMSPEVMTYVANMTDEEAKMNVAWAKQALDNMDVQIAENLQDQWLKAYKVTLIAENEYDARPKTLAEAFAAVGVDRSSLTLNGDQFRFAGLSPLFGKNKFDVVEPTQVQLAINALTAQQPLAALHIEGIKAIPIAAGMAEK